MKAEQTDNSPCVCVCVCGRRVERIKLTKPVSVFGINKFMPFDTEPESAEMLTTQQQPHRHNTYEEKDLKIRRIFKYIPRLVSNNLFVPGRARPASSTSSKGKVGEHTGKMCARVCRLFSRSYMFCTWRTAFGLRPTARFSCFASAPVEVTGPDNEKQISADSVKCKQMFAGWDVEWMETSRPNSIKEVGPMLHWMNEFGHRRNMYMVPDMVREDFAWHRCAAINLAAEECTSSMSNIFGKRWSEWQRSRKWGADRTGTAKGRTKRDTANGKRQWTMCSSECVRCV